MMTAALPHPTIPATDADANADAVSVADIVIIDWKDLQPSEDILQHILQMAASLAVALGTRSLPGQHRVSDLNVPGFVAAKQARVYPPKQPTYRRTTYLARAHGSRAPHSGWSHGKEKAGDIPDTAIRDPFTRSAHDYQVLRKIGPSHLSCQLTNGLEDRIPNFKTALNWDGPRETRRPYFATYIDLLAVQNTEDLAVQEYEGRKVKCRLPYYFPLSNYQRRVTSRTCHNSECND
jgi:hypothetical protein